MNSKIFSSKRIMEWIPYSQIKNLEEIAKGGFGIVLFIKQLGSKLG
jgi:hypothetical protein